MENQIIYIKTHRGDRTNIMAGFQLWNKESFIKNVLETKKGYRDSYRYGSVGGFVKNIKEMPLSLFDTEFGYTNHPFTEEQITEIFSKEISMQYGLHKKRSEIKAMSKKDLVIGKVYKVASNGDKNLYLGKVKRTTTKPSQQSWKPDEVVSVEEGYGFLYISPYGGNITVEAYNVSILKNVKKFECFYSDGIELLPEYCYTNRGYYYNSNTNTKLEILDL